MRKLCRETRVPGTGRSSAGVPLSAIAACAIIAVPTPACAGNSDGPSYKIDITGQTLPQALRNYAQVFGQQIIFSESLFEGTERVDLKGDYSAVDALDRILAGTELKYERSPNGTIMIRPRSEAQQPGATTLRLAQISQSTASIKSESSADEPELSSPTKLEEVVVTAQKREERLQDVPISISVMSGEQLDRSTARDVTDALASVPGVAVAEGAYSGMSQVPIRGVTSAGAVDGGASPTAYYLDSVPFGFVRSAFAPAPDAYDLKRVEVLRGPQGTLYGANALNGVVRVLTQDANLDKLEIKARGLISSTEGGGQNYGGDTALNVPIVDGKLAARAVLGYEDLSGWIDKPNRKDVNDAERRSVRLKINAQPTEQLSLGTSVWSSRNDYGGHSGGTKDGKNSSSVAEPIANDFDAYGLQAAYAFSRFTVTSNTSYLKFANDQDYVFGERGTPDEIFFVETLDAKTFAQEFAINSTHKGSWRWTAGAMYRDSEDGDHGVLPTIFDNPLIVRQFSESYAVFGELTRLFLDGQLELTAGLRYFEDEVAQHEKSRFADFNPGDLTDVKDTFSATTPRLILTWHASREMTAYLSYSEGFRSGFHQYPDVIAAPVPIPSVKPDLLKNYELGAKGSLWGGRLVFDTALYYIDWQDLQQSLVVNVPGLPEGVERLPLFVNSGSASGVGFDIGLTAAPVDALELGLTASWNDLAFDDDVFSDGSLLFARGQRIAGSAEYTLGASAAYVFPMGSNGFEGRLAASGHYTSELPNRRLGADGQVIDETGDPQLIAGAHLSIQAPNDWSASLFVDNINDERGAAQNYLQPDLRVRPRPRTVGVQLEYRFE